MDVEILIAFIIGLSPVSPEQQEIGDMNQDGAINVFDVIVLVREMLGCSLCRAVLWLDDTFAEFRVRNRIHNFGMAIKCEDTGRIVG